MSGMIICIAAPIAMTVTIVIFYATACGQRRLAALVARRHYTTGLPVVLYTFRKVTSLAYQSSSRKPLYYVAAYGKTTQNCHYSYSKR